MSISLSSTKQAFPMIYAYSTPQIHKHDGWTKIGYTEQKNVEDRIKQQTHTADIQFRVEWKGTAVFDDGSWERFTDKDFHTYLKKVGIENAKGTEWFNIDGPSGQLRFYEFKSNRGILKNTDTVEYTLREEQAEAVRVTKNYIESTPEGQFLWNAKPRFGKTLSVYDLCKKIKAKKILIVTNRPAIANSWYSDYARFLGTESGLLFISETDSLKGEPQVLTRKQYVDFRCSGAKPGFIEFISLQDLKGSLYFGGKFDKLKEIQELDWDILVIDEAHEGVDTFKTDVAFDQIKRKFTLHLSGTPFKALASDKFADNEIFNWTYADEQQAKREWDATTEQENPYEALPVLNLYTYQMSEIVKDELDRGIEINGETEEYAFDLNEFFATDSRGKFIHDSSVTKFLDALVTQTKFPFSTPELRNEIKHSFWLLNRVDSALALQKKLKEHPIFKDYKVVAAVGDGRSDDSEETQKNYDKVKKAIKTNDKTITLSVGQLTTGVTIPEWTAVLMLSNLKSPALYMQAAFRAQNPCMFLSDGTYLRKHNAYVFDFDPARTLEIYEKFANDLSTDTAAGHGDTDSRKNNIRRLLNFFPVIGEDDKGEMIALDAEKVLSIPRKIRSMEVVRRGFMSNYLFQNISGIFSAPKEIIEIIEKFQPVSEPAMKSSIPIDPNTAAELGLDPQTGEVTISEEQVIGTATELFGEKIFGEEAQETMEKLVSETIKQGEVDTNNIKHQFDTLKTTLKTQTLKTVIDKTQETFGNEMRKSDFQKMERLLGSKLDHSADKVFTQYQIEQKKADAKRLEDLSKRLETGRSEDSINEEHQKKLDQLSANLQKTLSDTLVVTSQEIAKQAVETVKRTVHEREKDEIENTVRDHLRGFSRTIPSFLMAYGDDSTSLQSFDTVIPPVVFKDVTSITVDQFRMLRDGGDYTEQETGAVKHFNGQLFDEVVFNDSVKEFLNLKKKLSDYFDQKNIEDIFDYIPPQKTNQIFTPKKTVRDMVDMLEKENPGCFDNSQKTFIDMYMKSGLYITEIVKRLYQSKQLEKEFPDPKLRLKHIFEEQVYGLAPTEIIYRIALAYILGFDETKDIQTHNFRQFDAVPYVKNGTLEQELEKLFGSEDK